MIIVQKYGGSSVATVGQIKEIAKRTKERIIENKSNKYVIVVSAMGKTTNNLISLAHEITLNPSEREMDQLLATGELQSVALLAMAMQNQGVDAISLSGAQAGIITTNIHLKAFIKEIKNERIIKYLNNGKLVIVAGFQGIDEIGNITTLGRGGSDTTAVALASSLGGQCEIYTDVAGIYTVDPRVNDKAKKHSAISFECMMEMSVRGAKVLEPRCVEIAYKNNVKIYLSKALEKEKKGTVVMYENDIMENLPITGLCIKDDIDIIICEIKKDIFNEFCAFFAEMSISFANFQVLNKVSFNNKVIFYFSVDDYQTQNIINSINNIFNSKKIKVFINSNRIQLSIVGSGMATHVITTSRVIKSLAENKIEFENISLSEICLSFIINKNDKQNAINTITELLDL